MKTDDSLDVEHEETKDAVARSIQSEEVDERVLRDYRSALHGERGGRVTERLTHDAAKDPLSQRRRCEMSSDASSGTSVSALEAFT